MGLGQLPLHRVHSIMSRVSAGEPLLSGAQSRSARGSKRRTSWVRRTSARIAARSGQVGPERAGLHQHVAQRGRLDRAGQHRQAAGVGGQLAQQRRCGRRRRPRARRRPRGRRARPACAHVPPVGQRQAVEDAAHHLGPASRAPARPCSRQPARRSAPACRPAAGTRGSSASTTVRSGSAVRPPPASSGAPGPSVAPRAQGLLEQPQAHHVAQVADRAVDAALVGEVRRAAARLGQHRRVELDADQRPGAAGDVRDGSSLGGHADHRGRGVVGADRDHGHVGAEAGRRDARQQRADHGRRRSRSGGRMPGGTPSRSASSAAHSPVRTSSSPVVEALVRSAPPPGQPVGEQVGDQQQSCRPLERSGVPAGDELVDRVERQVLQAGAPRTARSRSTVPAPAPRRRRCARRGRRTGCRAARRRRRAGRSRPPTSRCRCPSTGPPSRRQPQAGEHALGSRPSTSQCRAPPTSDRAVGEPVRPPRARRIVRPDVGRP